MAPIISEKLEVLFLKLGNFRNVEFVTLIIFEKLDAHLLKTWKFKGFRIRDTKYLGKVRSPLIHTLEILRIWIERP